MTAGWGAQDGSIKTKEDYHQAVREIGHCYGCVRDL